MEFIKGLPCASAQRVTQGSDTLDDLVVTEIEKEVEKVKERNNKKKKRIKMQVRPHLLYRVKFYKISNGKVSSRKRSLMYVRI